MLSKVLWKLFQNIKKNMFQTCVCNQNVQGKETLWHFWKLKKCND